MAMVWSQSRGQAKLGTGRKRAGWSQRLLVQATRRAARRRRTRPHVVRDVDVDHPRGEVHRSLAKEENVKLYPAQQPCSRGLSREVVKGKATSKADKTNVCVCQGVCRGWVRGEVDRRGRREKKCAKTCDEKRRGKANAQTLNPQKEQHTQPHQPSSSTQQQDNPAKKSKE